MKKETFEKLVEEAMTMLPKKFKKYIDNLAVIVEEKSPAEVYRQTRSSPYSRILGLYHGVPFKHRGPYYGNLPPDVIVIYQEPIEEICNSEEEVKQKVKEVVFHEVGHYFGLSDEELREIESDS
ncbi:MAG: metallopeptidase family protein [Candidatus Aminicenantes bacterium]|nr:metallopeptidase family protein [Candidatus Aminicenantes bacterium]MDH5384347.1 metallopeptidase family protein [Candidatus Aminicenantes bacterium]